VVLIEHVRDVREAKETQNAKEQNQHGRKDSEHNEQLVIELEHAGISVAAIACCPHDVDHAEDCPNTVRDVPVAIDEEEAIIHGSVAN